MILSLTLIWLLLPELVIFRTGVRGWKYIHDVAAVRSYRGICARVFIYSSPLVHPLHGDRIVLWKHSLSRKPMNNVLYTLVCTTRCCYFSPDSNKRHVPSSRDKTACHSLLQYTHWTNSGWQCERLDTHSSTVLYCISGRPLTIKCKVFVLTLKIRKHK